MNKLSKFSNKKLLVVFVGIVLIVVVGVGFAARSRVMPVAVGIFYKTKVQQKLQTEVTALGNPMQSLGLKTNQKSNNCGTMAAGLIRMQVSCAASVGAYSRLKTDDDGRHVAITAANTIETSLNKRGYVAGSNGVTITSLVTGVYQGKDYSPDAFYQKVGDGYTCTLDAFIAYSNPSPIAISMNQNCVRTINIFGKPTNATFDSNIGFPIDF